jgi:DNA-binding PucR family transcriptional regulator
VSRTGYPPAPSTVAVREAREALRSGRPGVTEYADIELESLLTSIGGWERFVAHTLDPVLERADLLATLDAYLRYAGNAARAAESLSIHRNTMRYRLSQCQALLGKDIDDANVAFAIQLALRLLKAHPDYLSGRGRSDH